MSRVTDESKHWPTEAEGEAALRDLHQQVENARHRLGQQWSQMQATDAQGSVDRGGGDQTNA